LGQKRQYIKPSEIYVELKNHIHHVHIKDTVMVNGKLTYTLLGQGETPILEAIDILRLVN
jgi:fatty-acyl-CoA synthase